MRRRNVTVSIVAPDHSRLIIAARRLPDSWFGPITDDSLARFANANPEWGYMVSGAQRLHTFRSGGSLFYEGIVDRW